MVNNPRTAEPAPVAAAGDAVSGADVPSLDPATMVGAEMAMVLGSPACTFRHTKAGKPVLAVAADDGPTTAAMNLNGKMLELRAAVSEGSVTAEDPPVRLSTRPEGDPRFGPVEAEMIFEIGHQLRVGYRGYIECAR